MLNTKYKKSKQSLNDGLLNQNRNKAFKIICETTSVNPIKNSRNPQLAVLCQIWFNTQRHKLKVFPNQNNLAALITKNIFRSCV